MKRGITIFLFLILPSLAFFLILPDVSCIDITGNALSVNLTGEALAAYINASITINAGPAITIYNPKENMTYRSTNVLLNYSVSDSDGISMILYNIDNAVNTSLGNDSSGYVYFNTTQGNKTLYFYANDSLNVLVLKTFYFSCNNTRIIVIYENFRNSTKGASTNFNSLNDELLENLSNTTLENTNYGKIRWNENLNMSEDINASDKITILDNYVIIGNASIYLNSTELPNLNKKATLWFYNLSFSNPRILKDGSSCSSSICTNQVYSSGTFRVNVTGFSNYSLEETPEENVTTPTGGGGGGGGTPIVITAFSIFYYPKIIKFSVLQGESAKEKFKIKNLDTKTLNFSLSSDMDYLSLSETAFKLQPNEEKEITATFSPSQTAKTDVYTGEILINIESNGVFDSYPISVIAELSSEKKLFDVALSVLPEYKKVRSGYPVLAKIDIYNLGLSSDRVDIRLKYNIRDMNNNIVIEQSEEAAVQTHFSDIRELVVPENLKEGQYLFTVNVTYNGFSAFATDSFEVTETRPFDFFVIIAVIVVITLVILFVIFERRKEKRIENIERKYLLRQYYKGKEF